MENTGYSQEILKMIIKNMDKSLMKGLSLVIMLVFLTSFISAFGVGFIGSDLKMYVGQDYDTTFSLRNTEEYDITLEATIETGSEYLTFTEGITTFNIPQGEYVEFPVKISIPADANIGDEYTVKVLFKNIGDIPEGVGGGTTIGIVFDQRNNINIEVVEKPQPKSTTPPPTPPATQTPAETDMTMWYWVIGIAVVLLVVWFIMKKKRK